MSAAKAKPATTGSPAAKPRAGIGQKAKRVKTDTILTNLAAQDLARVALEEVAQAQHIGDFIDFVMEDERLATLRFACQLPGYAGWHWAVTVARVPRARRASVCETELLPGPAALVAPAWLPWADRLQPGDLGPGDVLPHVNEDPRLEPGYTDTSQDADQVELWELGLGRARVLSPEGRDEAASRWYDGAAGPAAAEAVRATARCASCGFSMPLAGSMRGLFAVCANRMAGRDGQVVSLDHGCGAHSETDVARSSTRWPENAPMVDDSSLVPVQLHDAEETAGS
ncbi:MAG: DUF3027 domain-containing protein [Micrococcales bacterium]|nr:DUF3027 domain-containing protein [Micrococcales bacterium]